MKRVMNKMVKISIRALFLISITVGLISCGGDGDDKVLISSITFVDPNLAACVVSTPAIYVSDLTTLNCKGEKIADLSGIERLTSLTILDLDFNNINDISAISGLSELIALALNGNNVSDISALSGLTNLTNLLLNDNAISDISALSAMTDMTALDLNNNIITDISTLTTVLPGVVTEPSNCM